MANATRPARLTRANARAILAQLGCSLRRDESGTEWRVNFRGGAEATAYYTPDLGDAVDTGLAMVEHRNASPAAFAAAAAAIVWEPIA